VHGSLLSYQAILHHVDDQGEVLRFTELFWNASGGGFMRNESNWLEYLRKLANEGLDPSALKPTGREARSRAALSHTPHERDEWLKAGYTAQQSLPLRVNR
jgi:hypothetical protein